MTKEEIISALNDMIDELRACAEQRRPVDHYALIKTFQALRDFVVQHLESVTITRLNPPSRQAPKDWSEFWNFITTELGLTTDDARYLWNNWKANGFTRNGKMIKDWKAAARAWKAGKFYPSQKTK